MTLAQSLSSESDALSDNNTDTTGYSSDEEFTSTNSNMFSVINPMIVVSNRLPFVLKRNQNGGLERKSRFVKIFFCLLVIGKALSEAFDSRFLKYILFSAGGLVTAVAPVVVESEGLWVGWTGLEVRDRI